MRSFEVDASVAESKTPLAKLGRHEPSLDIPCGLLGISGIPPSPEIGREPALSEVEWGWGEGRISAI